MAPEQAAGHSQLIGPAADIHALGAILYEMLTGRPPFQGVNLVEILEQVMNAEPPAPSRLVARIPKPLSIICLKCLSKAPARRYPSATALADDLRRWQDGEAISARPTGRLERMTRRIYRHPLRSALVVSAALLVFSAAMMFVLDRERRMTETARAEQEKNAIRSEEDAKYSASLYDATHGALESVLEHINNDAKLRNAPGVRELQAVMRDRYEHLVGLLEQDSRSHDRMPLASAYDRLGKLYNRDDKTELALKNYGQSSHIYEGMLPEETTPDRATRVRLRLGLSLTEQGNLLFDLGRLDKAEAIYRNALVQLEDARNIVAAEPDLPARKPVGDGVSKSIAEVNHRLGTLLQSRGKRKESLEEFKRALAIRTALIAGNKNDKEFERDLARSYGYQGDVELELGLNTEAETSYWKSHEIRKRLYKREPVTPDEVEAAFQYARSLQNFGNYHVRTRNFATARHFFTQTEAIQKDVLQKESDNLDYISDLAATQIRLAEMGLLQKTSHEDSIKQLLPAHKALVDLFARDPNNVSLSSSLAESYLLLGLLSFDDPKTRSAAVANLLDAMKYLEMPIKTRAEADYKYLLASAQALYSENLGRPLREDSGWFRNLKEALEQGYSRKDLRDVENDRAFRQFKDNPAFRKLLKLEPVTADKNKAS